MRKYISKKQTITSNSARALCYREDKYGNGCDFLDHASTPKQKAFTKTLFKRVVRRRGKREADAALRVSASSRL